jgi:hypothetical protein
MAKLNLTKILTESGALVAGGIASNVVAKNIPIQNEQLKKALPVALGAFLLTNKNPMVRNLGAGMVAVQGTAVAKGFVPGLGGVGEDVMLAEDVMLSGMSMGEVDDPLMGNVPFSNDSYATTGAYDFTNAGEMSY